MNTPICDFISRYANSNALRLHMPGHKGKLFTGAEKFDITEIAGADSLYEAAGIIRESERNTSRLFGSGDTLYSTEGSSQCIRAMIYLAALSARAKGKRPLIAAGRNAHKSFVSACALIDCDVMWITGDSYLSCNIDADELDASLLELEYIPDALYVTSPDYLGNLCDIGNLRRICDKYGMLLIVDNAHGAYLNFLEKSQHPMALGADVCCDSAHKTLPVLTGGAYLHISVSAPRAVRERARDAMALFGSTSPSYLILCSLDKCSAYLDDTYREKLAYTAFKIKELKESLSAKGWCFIGDEPLKLTVCAKRVGYTGYELARILKKENIVCEFLDPDYLVMMITPETGDEGLKRLSDVFAKIVIREPISDMPPQMKMPERVKGIREAMFCESELIPVSDSIGRVLAVANVACPPAVPIVVCGERIDGDAVKCFDYYGIDKCRVIIK